MRLWQESQIQLNYKEVLYVLISDNRNLTQWAGL